MTDQKQPQSTTVDVAKQINQAQSPGSRGLRDVITRLDRPVTMMSNTAQKQDKK